MSNKKAPIPMGACNGFGPLRDQAGVDSQSHCFPEVDGLTVLPFNMRNSVITGIEQFRKGNRRDEGVLSVGYVDENQIGELQYVIGPPIWDAPNPGLAEGYFRRFSPGTGAITGVTVPYTGTCGFLPPQTFSKDGVETKKTNIARPYLASDCLKSQVVYINRADDVQPKWDQKNDIQTAQSGFGSIPFLGMIQGLAGQILSLASAFGGLSAGQKQQIQNSVPADLYPFIDYTFTNTTDIADTTSASLSSRVDANTFANNIVTMLCNCKTTADVVNAMNELRTNTQLHGKDKLPTVTHNIPGAFGDITLTIDGHGNYTSNLSPQAEAALARFNTIFSQGVQTANQVCTFDGQITGNTLTVTKIYEGHLIPGPQHEIYGLGVSANTYILNMRTRGADPLGNYILSVASNTPANTEMKLYKVVNNPMIYDANGMIAIQESLLNWSTLSTNTSLSMVYAAFTSNVANTGANTSTAGGGGGGGGAIMGFNGLIFGTAGVHLGQALPTMFPASAAGVLGMLGGLQSMFGTFGRIMQQKAGKIPRVVAPDLKYKAWAAKWAGSI